VEAVSEREPFGFSVIRATTGYPNYEPTDDWEVILPAEPHSEEIYITGLFGAPHQAAISELERFIAEAQDALVALRERRETEEWRP
jgi:hypothetical protein